MAETLSRLHPAAKDLYPVHECLEIGGKSAELRKLLEFEDRLGSAADSIAAGRGSIQDLLTVVGNEFEPAAFSEALQVIIFGGGALQLLGKDDVTSTASISLKVLHPNVIFPPPEFPLHADPVLSDVVAHLNLDNLIDSLKPIRSSAILKKLERAEESGSAAAGAS